MHKQLPPPNVIFAYKKIPLLPSLHKNCGCLRAGSAVALSLWYSVSCLFTAQNTVRNSRFFLVMTAIGTYQANEQRTGERLIFEGQQQGCTDGLFVAI